MKRVRAISNYQNKVDVAKIKVGEKSMSIDILLSTYNGQRYLEAQLNSLFSQTYSNWKLLIRDDASTDGTMEIIQHFQNKHPDKLFLISNPEGNVGFALSYLKLMKYSDADYLMFCDQDDVWNSDKIEKLVKHISENEKENPYLAFADSIIVNDKREIIYQSYAQLTGLNYRKGQQIYLLKNYIPGCNFIFNKKLKQKALEVNFAMPVHDFWLLMIAAAIGKVGFVNEPLMQYRLHPGNAIGLIGKPTGFWRQVEIFVKDFIKYAFNNARYRENLYKGNLDQLKMIADIFPSELSPEAFQLVNITNSSYFIRKYQNLKIPYVLNSNFLERLKYVICF